MKSAVAFCLAAVTACTFVPATAFAQGQLLRIQELQGKAELQRGGRSQSAAEGGVLQADDTLVLAAGARAALKLGRHGLVEVGPGASVQIERLPFATYAADLRTVLRLQQGYLRVIWKQPPLDINWPLFVYVDTDSANLITGEYFFEKSGDRRALCSAEGDLSLTGPGHSEGTKVEADSCWIVAPGVAGLRKAVDMDDWVAVRQGRALGRVAEAPKTAVAAAPAPMPASPPPVVATTTPAAEKPAEKPADKPQPSPAVTVAGSSPNASSVPGALAAAQPTLPVYTPKPSTEPPKPATSASPTPSTLPAYKPSPAPSTSAPALNPNPAPLPTYKPATPPPAAVVAEAPKPASVPASVPTPKPAATQSGSGGRWAVNVASVPDRASAQKELAKLGKAGFAGGIAEADVKGKTWYRVQVQGLPNKEEADDIAKQLKSAGYAAAWVIKP